jgi:hypothetical protein
LNALSQLESVVTIFAIVAGALWTYMLFIQRRQRFPRARVSHRTLIRPVTPSSLLFRVTVSIENTGEVIVRLTKGEVWIQRVEPIADALLESVRKGRDPVREGKAEFDWPLEAERKIESASIEIEPGESENQHFDFVLSSEIRSVLLYSHLENEKKRARWFSRNRVPVGWNTTTFEKTQLGVESMSDTRRPTDPDGTKQAPKKERPIQSTPPIIQSPKKDKPSKDDRFGQGGGVQT